MNGAFVVVEIAYMFGQTLQHWSYQMGQTDGFVSFSMENLQQCIQAEALKMGAIVQVNNYNVLNFYEKKK